MASGTGNPYFDDERSKPEVIDPPHNEDMMDAGESVYDLPQSGLKTKSTVTSSVRNLLECPMCLNAMYPPIHQCSNGHTLCSVCKPRVKNRWRTCRHELGNIRCLALEKVAASLELPCSVFIDLTIAPMLDQTVRSLVVYLIWYHTLEMIVKLICILEVLSIIDMSNQIHKRLKMPHG